jgi:hypothetical protein
MRHRHLIYLHEHTVGQNRIKVDELFARTSLLRGERGPPLHEREWVRIDGAKVLRLENRRGLRRIEEILPTDVLAAARQYRALQESFDHIARAFFLIIITDGIDNDLI